MNFLSSPVMSSIFEFGYYLLPLSISVLAKMNESHFQRYILIISFGHI